MSGEQEPGCGEAEPFQIDAKIQFEDGPLKSFMVEQYMLESRVEQVIAAILRMDAVDININVHPQDLVMSVILPGQSDGEVSKEVDLDGSTRLEEYIDEMCSCQAIKLKRSVINQQ